MPGSIAVGFGILAGFLLLCGIFHTVFRLPGVAPSFGIVV